MLFDCVCVFSKVWGKTGSIDVIFVVGLGCFVPWIGSGLSDLPVFTQSPIHPSKKEIQKSVPSPIIHHPSLHESPRTQTHTHTHSDRETRTNRTHQRNVAIRLCLPCLSIAVDRTKRKRTAHLSSVDNGPACSIPSAIRNHHVLAAASSDITKGGRDGLCPSPASAVCKRANLVFGVVDDDDVVSSPAERTRIRPWVLSNQRDQPPFLVHFIGIVEPISDSSSDDDDDR